MADDKSKAASAAGTGTGVVARGRTVIGPHPTETETFGNGPDGKPIVRPVHTTFNPGDTVTLPAGEIARLRGLGFLVDPDGSGPAVDIGPTFSTKA
jgi:hypothetical protein